MKRHPPPSSQTIRVDVEVVEHLMTLVSELVLARNQLLQLARAEQDSPYAAPLQRLSPITSDPQGGVMKTRMQPIGNVWNMLPRLVRDLAHELGKRIELVMHGADTELDRQVLELIKDPLTHMVRNCCDQGLETPEERRAGGKTETGRITLAARHEGGYILINIADDGRGLPAEQTGAGRFGITIDRVFDAEEIVVKPLAPILRHLTLFSGNTILGDGSVIMILDPEGIARAIGHGGEAEIGPVPSLPEPQDAARTALLLFRAGGSEPKAVPLCLVARLEMIPLREIEHSGGRMVMQYRGRLMPLVSMAEHLDAAPPRQAALVIAGTDEAGRERCMGLLVDEILDVVEDVVRIELGGEHTGLAGSAVIAGRATEIIDTGYWLTRAFPDWFEGASPAADPAFRLVA